MKEDDLLRARALLKDKKDSEFARFLASESDPDFVEFRNGIIQLWAQDKTDLLKKLRDIWTEQAEFVSKILRIEARDKAKTEAREKAEQKLSELSIG